MLSESALAKKLQRSEEETVVELINDSQAFRFIASSNLDIPCNSAFVDSVEQSDAEALSSKSLYSFHNSGACFALDSTKDGAGRTLPEEEIFFLQWC